MVLPGLDRTAYLDESSSTQYIITAMSVTVVNRAGLLLEPGGRVPRNEVVKWSESFSE